MTTNLRLLAATLLVALAACVVDTSDLEPKTDAECAATARKACGPRCVEMNSPETGCGNPGCSPCPAASPGWTAFCNYTACDYREICGTGEAQCDDLGLCEDLQNDSLHCGACFHGCGLNSCTAGTCIPSVSWADPIIGYPIDIATVPSGIIYLVDGAGGSWGNGRLMSSPIVTGLGMVDRLEVDAEGNAYIANAGAGASIAYVPFGAAAASPFFTPQGAVEAMAVTPFELLVTTSGGTAGGTQDPSYLLVVPRSVPAATAALDVGLGPLAGVGYDALDDLVYVGSRGGQLGWVNPADVTSGILAGGLSAPARIAIFRGPVRTDPAIRTIAFWASEADGSVRSMELPSGTVRNLWPASLATSRMDIWADVTGVYWSDLDNGIVAEWRPQFDDVVVLHRGGMPMGVTQWSGWVMWADLGGSIYNVPH